MEIELTHGLREPLTQIHEARVNHPVHKQSNALLRLSPDVLLKIITHYLNLSETALFMLTCRHVLRLVNNDYPWKVLYQRQLHTNQYLDDPFSRHIQKVAHNRTQQTLAYKRLYKFFAQARVPLGVKAVAGAGDPRFEPKYNCTCKQLEILQNGNIAMLGIDHKVSILTSECKHVADLWFRHPLDIFYPSEVISMFPLADRKSRLVTLDEIGPSVFHRTVRIWSAKGNQIFEFLTNSTSYIAGLSNGNFVIVSTHQVILYSPAGEAIAVSQDLAGLLLPIQCSAVLPNGNIVIGSKNKAIVWSCENNRLVAEATLNGSMMHMAVLLNRNIVTRHTDRAIIGAIIWSSIGTPIHECVVSNEDHLKDIVVLTNGNFTTVHGNAVYIWSPDGQLLTLAKGHINDISSIAALPDGGFVTASQDNTARIWSPIGMQVAILRHKRSVNCVKVFPNGDILTASLDGRIRIWTVDAEALIRIQNFNKYRCPSWCSVS